MKCPYCKIKIFKGYYEGKVSMLELADFITYTHDGKKGKNKKVGTQINLHSCYAKKLLPNQKDLFT